MNAAEFKEAINESVNELCELNGENFQMPSMEFWISAIVYNLELTLPEPDFIERSPTDKPPYA